MGLDKDDTIVEAPHGAEDAVPGRGRGGGARAHQRRAARLVREERRQVRAAEPRELPASVLRLGPARCSARTTTRWRRSRSSPASRRTRSSRRRSRTRSCSRTTTATGPPSELAKEFGPPFAVAVEKLAPGSWQGPIESGYGWHLVFVDTVVPGRVPAFEEVEPDVKTAWLGEQKERAREDAYKAMRAKYTVLLPAPPAEPSASAAPPPRSPCRIPPTRCRRCEPTLRGVARAARRLRGAGARVAPRVPRAEGDRARAVRSPVAHAGARGHAPADRAADPGRRAQREAARGAGARRLARRAALARRRAERARGQAHRLRRPAAHDHRRAGARADARRPDLDGDRARLAAVGRDRGVAVVVGGRGDVRRAGAPAHPVRRRPPACSCWGCS